MKLRIGDLIYYKDSCSKGKGLITGLHGFHICKDCIEIIEKKADIRFIIPKNDIIKVIPREEIKEYWRYL